MSAHHNKTASLGSTLYSLIADELVLNLMVLEKKQ